MTRPGQGGSYVRAADGSLQRVEATAPAAAGADRRDAGAAIEKVKSAPATSAPTPAGKSRTKEK